MWTGFDADGFRDDLARRQGPHAFSDWKNGAALALRDLTTGSSYRLASGGQTQFSAIPEGRQAGRLRLVRRTTVTRGDRPHTTSSRETARHEHLRVSRRLLQNDEVEGAAPFPDWSPDGTGIAVGVVRKDGTHQIPEISASVRDGSPPRVEVG